MFGIVLTQPMALEEIRLIKSLVNLYGAEPRTVTKLQIELDHCDQRMERNYHWSANSLPGTRVGLIHILAISSHNNTS